MNATQIDWSDVRRRMDGATWRPGIRPDPDAGPYETRRVRVLAESDCQDAGWTALIDEAIAHGYQVHTPKGDGVWVSECRYLEPA